MTENTHTVELRREGGGVVARVDVPADRYGENIYIIIDGREYGSVWVHDDGDTPVVTLGQFKPESFAWEDCNDLRPIDLDMPPS